jgi:chorismate dehydratase
MSPLKLGYVQYLNTLPLVEGLSQCADLAMHPAVPSKLADMLVSGQVDLALASLVDATRAASDTPAATHTPLALVPCGMIGCDGPTLTVRLYSAVPWARVDRLHADTDSHTSVVLARLILDMVFGRRVELVDFDTRAHANKLASATNTDWPETLLEIGDKVVTDAPPDARYPHQLDLGAAWKDLTGLPFVYAMWMCRASEADSPSIAWGAQLLERQRRRNTARLDWLVSRASAQRRWPEELARHYVRDCLRYEVTPEARQGAERFIHEASRRGLLPTGSSNSLRWATIAPTPVPAPIAAPVPARA